MSKSKSIVDQKLSTLAQPQQTVLLKQAQLIRNLIPGATECISYNLPAFTKTFSPLVKFAVYRLIVWLDVASAPNTFAWNTYGTSNTNQVDYSPQSFLEYFEMDEGYIWVDSSFVQYNKYQSNTSKSLSEGSSQDQVIDISVGRYFQ